MTGRRAILISGARKGIGLGLVRHYVGLGYYVIGCSRRSGDFQAPNYEHHLLDVRDEAAVVRLFSYLRAKFGGLTALINNAGVAGMNHALLTPMSAVRDILETNVSATFLLSREAAKLLRVTAHGRIVNISSVAVPLRLQGEAIYAASKSAVEMLTRVLAKEFAPVGITCNAVGPGPVKTDLIRGVPEDKIALVLASQAIPRHAEVEDIANVVDFFLRAESDFVTGQVIYLGGVS
jgi:3-oxoacyl-[acyl-carrier protein] reductase